MRREDSGAGNQENKDKQKKTKGSTTRNGERGQR